jgi:hypothetical protein
MIAVFTLALHPVAIRIWIASWKKCGGLIGSAAFLAFSMTAFTSLGGLATRTDHANTEHQHEINTENSTQSQIKVLETERDGLKFKRTTQETVDAAKRSADAAKTAKERECGNGDPKQRGPFCRDKETNEEAANKALTEAQSNKDATERFEQIKLDLDRLRPKTGQNSVSSTDPLLAFLKTIMSAAWATFLAGWEKVFLAVVYDICMVASMIGIEVLGHIPTKRREDKVEMPAKPQSVSTTPASIQPVRTEPALIEADAEPVTPAKLPPPARPKLAVVKSEPFGNVNDYVVARLETAPEHQLEFGEMYCDYEAWCSAQGLRPLTVEQFAEALKRVCSKARVRIQRKDGTAYLIGLRLAQQSIESASA